MRSNSPSPATTRSNAPTDHADRRPAPPSRASGRRPAASARHRPTMARRSRPLRGRQGRHRPRCRLRESRCPRSSDVARHRQARLQASQHGVGSPHVGWPHRGRHEGLVHARRGLRASTSASGAPVPGSAASPKRSVNGASSLGQPSPITASRRRAGDVPAGGGFVRACRRRSAQRSPRRRSPSPRAGRAP